MMPDKPTIESCTREAAALLFSTATTERVADGALDAETSIAYVLDSVISLQRQEGRLNTGESKLASLVLCLWNGSAMFSVHDLAALDQRTREAVVGIVTRWAGAIG